MKSLLRTPQSTTPGRISDDVLDMNLRADATKGPKAYTKEYGRSDSSVSTRTMDRAAADTGESKLKGSSFEPHKLVNGSPSARAARTDPIGIAKTSDSTGGTTGLWRTRIMRELERLYRATTLLPNGSGSQQQPLGLQTIARSLGEPLRTSNSTVQVLCIGAANTGKSTFINWFCGRDILPTGVGRHDADPCVVVVGRGGSRKHSSQTYNESPDEDTECPRLNGATTLKYAPHLVDTLQTVPQMMARLFYYCVPEPSKRLTTVTLIDTPGIQGSGDNDDCFSVQVAMALAKVADVVLVFLDPIAIPTGLGHVISTIASDQETQGKMRFLLSKMDTIPHEAQRMKVICRLTQSMAALVPSVFNILPIYISANSDKTIGISSQTEEEMNKENYDDGNRKQRLSIANGLLELTRDIELLVEYKVQNDLLAAAADVARLKHVMTDIWQVDQKHRQLNSLRRVVRGLICTVQIFLLLGITGLLLRYLHLANVPVIPTICSLIPKNWRNTVNLAIEVHHDTVSEIVETLVTAARISNSMSTPVLLGLCLGFVALMAIRWQFHHFEVMGHHRVQACENYFAFLSHAQDKVETLQQRYAEGGQFT